MNISRIEKMIADNSLDEAAAALKNESGPDADYLRGRIAWKRGDRAAAIAAYSASAVADPKGPGAIALDQTRDIMDFFNHDLYNP